MADSPNLWDAFTAVIKAGPNPPTDASGQPILDVPLPDGSGGTWPRVQRGRTRAKRLTVSGESKDVLPPPGYILLAQEFENEAGCYQEPGQDGLYRMTCWANTPDDARRLYRWFKRILQGVALVVEGYQPVAGILSKSGPFPDPDGAAWGVEATYRAEPFEAAA
jgi:hypothetical protein